MNLQAHLGTWKAKSKNTSLRERQEFLQIPKCTNTHYPHSGFTSKDLFSESRVFFNGHNKISLCKTENKKCVQKINTWNSCDYQDRFAMRRVCVRNGLGLFLRVSFQFRVFTFSIHLGKYISNKHIGMFW